MHPQALTIALQLAAITQATLAIVNLFLIRIMNWRPALNRLPLLPREVFVVHGWFISITLAIFAVMTWRFAPDIAAGTNEPLRWLAAAIATFWSVRFILQWTYYSHAHWLGKPRETIVHIACCIVYGSWAATYVVAAFNHV